MSLIQKKNHLLQETSPYLQQHVFNPVDWYPWSQVALEKARYENKPILLSIGYAACHWCHVMAHESFEDSETAKLMNQYFVNIKVDREERPDLDKIYQTSHQLLTQTSGGWPLTIFLTPDDLIPFFSGTYFPREARYHLPAFKDVLRSIANAFQHQLADIKKQNLQLVKILNAKSKAVFDAELNLDAIQQAIHVYQKTFDPVSGGFGGAPKFPQAARLEFLMRNKASLAIGTLQQMADGGIYDQLAGGFYRYTVDANWRIPHFEKMLYDNAQLLYLYALAAKQYDVISFRETARNTAQWIVENMQSIEGGFYSSFDADSEGHEGKYYVWDKVEIKKILNENECAIVELHYGLNLPANFEGFWHLYIAQSLESVAATLSMTEIEVQSLLTSAKEKLLTMRNQRIPPFCDKKILTAWNALMIKAMLTAGEILQVPALTASAEKSLKLIQQKLWVNKRLLASYHEDKAQLAAYLDDYAYLLDALITKLQIAWDTDYLLMAIDLAEVLLSNFVDQAQGGFYFTGNDHEKLLYRPKTTMDEAMPSGNAIATRALLTLGHLLGEARYLSAAEKSLLSAWNLLQEYPAEHPSFLLALEDFLMPPQVIILRGTEDKMKMWRAAVSNNSLIFSIPDILTELPGALMLRKSQGEVCAYVCQGVQCKTVIHDINEFKESI